MTRTVPMDKGEEILYKSFELTPLPKMSVQSGEKATISALNRTEYLANLTCPKNLSWLGYDRTVVPMDVNTALLVRDHPVHSAIKRTIEHGIAHQYGNVLLKGKASSEPLIGVSSAIALAQKDERGDVNIIHKKQLGLEDKQGHDLVKEFSSPFVENQEKGERELKAEERQKKLEEKKKEPPVQEKYDIPWKGRPPQDHQEAVLRLKKEQPTPPLKKEKTPPVKKSMEVAQGDDGYVPPWEE